MISVTVATHRRAGVREEKFQDPGAIRKSPICVIDFSDLSQKEKTPFYIVNPQEEPQLRMTKPLSGEPIKSPLSMILNNLDILFRAALLNQSAGQASGQSRAKRARSARIYSRKQQRLEPSLVLGKESTRSWRKQLFNSSKRVYCQKVRQITIRE
jgi:hypothetical protein